MTQWVQISQGWIKTDGLNPSYMVSMKKARYIEWVPREDRYEVIDYRYKKWYLLKSLIDWLQIYMWTGDSLKTNKFYK